MGGRSVDTQADAGASAVEGLVGSSLPDS